MPAGASNRATMPSRPDPANAPEPLLAALLLSATAGLLDALTYLLHGHVFATAMTGNTVLLGVTVLAGNGSAVLLHAAPLVGYMLGVLASKLLRLRLGVYASPTALLFEAVALVAAGFMHRQVSEIVFTGAIAFVSGVQVTGFRQVGAYPYNSTFLTGDLREVGEAFLEWLRPGAEPKRKITARGRFADLTFVFTAFLGGAAVGALASRAWNSAVYWFPVPILLVLAPASLRWAQRASTQEASSADANRRHAI